MKNFLSEILFMAFILTKLTSDLDYEGQSKSIHTFVLLICLYKHKTTRNTVLEKSLERFLF